MIGSRARLLVAALAAQLAPTLACFSERATSALPVADASLCGASPPPAVVQIRDFSFQPAAIRVPTGSTVTWVNCEGSGGPAHTTTSDGDGWDSGFVPPGTTFTRTFAQAGRLTYHCEPHPVMKGTVMVE